MQRTLRLFPLALALCGGCRSSAQLDPAPSAQTPQGVAADQAETAITSVHGVEVRAFTGDWPGEIPVEYEVTPLRIVVENRSQESIRVTYPNFYIRGRDGAVYSAIPPFAVEGQVPDREVDSAYEPMEPNFVAYEYAVLKPYRPLYPGMSYYGEAVRGDPSYYDDFSYWESRRLPTAEMLSRAIPEGVLRPGGKLEGWMYFEKVPASKDRVTMYAELMSAESSDRFGLISIPFVVE